jgi:hypothetical protein
LQERIDSVTNIDKQAVEFATFNPKNSLDAERNSIVKLKRSLPDDLRSVPHDLLMTGMAYNNDPDELPLCSPYSSVQRGCCTVKPITCFRLLPISPSMMLKTSPKPFKSPVTT